MTKVSVFGQKPIETKQLKKIEFFDCISIFGTASVTALPSSWDNIQLFIKNYRGGDLDIILAWDNSNENDKVIYLGNWNDGIV